MDLVSKREFARRVGVSHTAVNKAVETGRLCYANGTRLLDYETARGQWFDGSDVSKMTDARLSEFEKQRAVYLKDTRTGSEKIIRARLILPKTNKEKIGSERG